MKKVIVSAIVMVALLGSGNMMAQDNNKKCPKAKTECCNKKKCNTQCKDKKACCTENGCDQKCDPKQCPNKEKCNAQCPKDKKKNCSKTTCPVKK
ncbi:hypothetical protein [Parabacteroides pacaensis]|uniref:hypothetical protein n=1 Tax=Parabacteroides pacaensis TaxID=2086575 RepID=UPI000D10D495|nr:hypothetical protein [Parabacteroides pacaensis]